MSLDLSASRDADPTCTLHALASVLVLFLMELAGEGAHSLLVSANKQLEMKLPKLSHTWLKPQFLSLHLWCV